MNRREFVVSAAALSTASGCLGDSTDEDENGGSEPYVTLSLSGDELELPHDAVTAEATKERGEPLTTTPTSLVLNKRVDGSLFWIHPPLQVFYQDGPAVTVESDEPMTWDVEARREPSYGWSSGYSVGGIGPGEYVLDFAYRRDAYLSDEGFDAPSARFEVVGEPLSLGSLGPVDTVDAEREGDATVRMDADDGESGVGVTLRRTDDSADEPPTLITEQVVRTRLLRNLLYYAVVEDAENVEVICDGSALELMDARLRTVGSSSSDVRRFEYDGTAYEIEKTDAS